MSVSVCTLSANRDRHLLAQLEHVRRGTSAHREHVIVFMGQRERPWETEPDGVRVVEQAGGIELARARNRAAAEAAGDVLVFLDVDVLPGPDAVARLAGEAREHDALVMADPWYLAPDWDRVSDPALSAIPHPARAELRAGPSDRYEMFWSLGFAITREALERIGGFDEGYLGYGGEDTDFAFAAREAGVPLRFSPARVFHQAHAVVKPPLHHAADIVRNANRFASKWGALPMEGWLAAFAERGIVEIEPVGPVPAVARLLREPSEAEIRAASLPDARF